MRAYQWFESGQLSQFWGDDPPAKLIEGVAYYHTVLGKIREKQWEAERDKK
jgi:hypothetical protein